LIIIYAAYLICGDKKEVREAVDSLESMMLTYQQISFYPLLDTVYSILTVGYFCLKEYDKVEEVFKRYRKVTKNKVVIPENDQTIHGFYYTSKWLETSRKQYAQKFNLILEEAQKANLNRTHKILKELATYFKLPIVFEKP
jgi:hypothetical protein